MNGSPAFQFYPADWLSDEKVISMSIEGEGCYIRLLCYCWREGSIPADRSAIALLCKGYNGPGIDEALTCFSPSRKKGRLINKRIEAERKKQELFRKSKQDAGLRGADKRWHSYGSANVLPMAKDSSLSLSSSSPSINPPLPPLKGGRKFLSKRIGDSSDPRYREAYLKRKSEEVARKGGGL